MSEMQRVSTRKIKDVSSMEEYYTYRPWAIGSSRV